jgi:hypothetical protein
MRIDEARCDRGRLERELTKAEIGSGQCPFSRAMRDSLPASAICGVE